MAHMLSRLAESLRTPGLRRKPVIGLSIEGNDLRLICVSDKEIVRFVSRTLDPNVMPGGTIVDAAAFGAEVRTILAEYDLPPATVVAAFPDMDARSRLLTLPKDAKNRAAEVVRREARHDPLIGTDDYRVFHQIVEEGGAYIKVFLLAVRRSALANFVQGLELGNIVPQMVELRPLAMIRAINQPHTIIVNAEPTLLDVVIVSNYLPVIMRSVPLAEGNALSEVVNELERTIASYDSNHPNRLSPRLPIALAGDLSTQPELAQSIQERTGHPIAPLACPFSAPPGFAMANFIVNIGLVLKAR